MSEGERLEERHKCGQTPGSGHQLLQSGRPGPEGAWGWPTHGHPCSPASLRIKRLNQNGFLFLPCYFYCYSTVGNPAGRAELVGNCSEPAARATGPAVWHEWHRWHPWQLLTQGQPGLTTGALLEPGDCSQCFQSGADINNPLAGVGKDEHMCPRLWSPHPLAAPAAGE